MLSLHCLCARDQLRDRYEENQLTHGILAELTLSILRHIPDTKTLHSFIKASPTFHSLYLTDRERVFTQATINQLYSKNVDILGPARSLVQVILEPGNQLLLAPYDHKLFNTLHEAIDALYAQEKFFKEDLVLSINSCKALLRIRVMVKWEVVEEKGKDAIVRSDKVLDRDSFFWSWCLGYHVIAPGDDGNVQRYWMRRKAVNIEHENQKLLLFGTSKAWEEFRKARWNAELLLRSA